MRVVDRQYLIQLLNECYKQQESNCSFCKRKNCTYCKKSSFLEEELRLKKFNTLNSDVLKWKVMHEKNDTTIMTEITEVKYTAANNSIHAAEPIKSTAGSAGYDLFAAEEKT